jgi:predicted house-cleaning NTP pyrophosphatase (Maf/HAM1 superfamily)
MPLLLVDDRDGRILSEIQTEDEARQVLEAWSGQDRSLPEYVCLIEVRSHDGEFLVTDSSVKMRPLSLDLWLH